MPKNFQRVEGNIYRGGILSKEDLKILHDIYYIKRIISLDASAASQIDAESKSLKIEHIICPLTGSETGMTDPLNQLMRNIVNWLTEKQPVFIGCLHGSDRTGLAVAAYRVKHDGRSVNDALAEARKFGYGSGISVATQSFYKKLLMTLRPVDVSSLEDADIVSNMRDHFSDGEVAAAIDPQQSFAPPSDDPTQKHRLCRTQVLMDIADVNDIPLIGFRDHDPSQNGAGVVDRTGILSEEY